LYDNKKMMQSADIVSAGGIGTRTNTDQSDLAEEI
jgi:hypothetical protein